jgi:hypothetical protein
MKIIASFASLHQQHNNAMKLSMNHECQGLGLGNKTTLLLLSYFIALIIYK